LSEDEGEALGCFISLDADGHAIIREKTMHPIYADQTLLSGDREIFLSGDREIFWQLSQNLKNKGLRQNC